MISSARSVPSTVFAILHPYHTEFSHKALGSVPFPTTGLERCQGGIGSFD
jgi:hypothetical protein